MKKNLTKLFSAVAMSAAIPVNAQLGLNCAFPIEVTEDQCFEGVTIDAGQKWFSFTATTDAEVIKVVNSNDPSDKHIHKVYVYDECTQLLRSDDMETGQDVQLDIILFALIPGHTYQVGLVNDENPGCPKCGIDNNSEFEICFTSAPGHTLSGCISGYCSDPCDNENLFNGGFEAGPVGFGN